MVAAPIDDRWVFFVWRSDVEDGVFGTFRTEPKVEFIALRNVATMLVWTAGHSDGFT